MTLCERQLHLLLETLRLPGLPQNVKDNLEKCRAAALAAVEAYNRPGPRFRTAQYLVMIVIAWNALLHAMFYKRRRRPWYRTRGSSTGKGVRYVKVDGDPKHWDLMECLKQYYGDKHPPERQNLEFLIGLRNKIEHRHLPELDAALYGECQAALMNLEALLVSEFGDRYAMTEQLAVSLQFSRVTPAEQRRSAKVLASSAARTVKDYVEKFRGNLPSTILSSMKYSFNVFLIPKLANRQSASDAAVEFIKVDEASSAELERLEKLNVLIREKQIPIANLDLFKPGAVVKRVAERLPFTFHVGHHTDAWKHFKVRPAGAASNPHRTQSEYCVYDTVHRDYVYTQAWIDKLVRELKSQAGFTAVTGRTPTPA